MNKRVTIPLYFGIMGFVSGIVLGFIDGIPKIIAIMFCSIGSALVAVAIANRGGFAIRDEMVMRVESLSGQYTCVLTLYFIMVLSIVHFFHPLQVSVSGLLLTMMMFMSFSYIIIRYYLMKWGKAE
jgi:hypothetical protein